jgi:hypothetical protein
VKFAVQQVNRACRRDIVFSLALGGACGAAWLLKVRKDKVGFVQTNCFVMFAPQAKRADFYKQLAIANERK